MYCRFWFLTYRVPLLCGQHRVAYEPNLFSLAMVLSFLLSAGGSISGAASACAGNQGGNPGYKNPGAKLGPSLRFPFPLLQPLPSGKWETRDGKWDFALQVCQLLFQLSQFALSTFRDFAGNGKLGK